MRAAGHALRLVDETTVERALPLRCGIEAASSFIIILPRQQKKTSR